MKAIFLFSTCLFSLSAVGQYSNFYTIDQNVNHSGSVTVNSNINKNVNVSGNVRKTITTIDYGALAQANALKEQNRLKSMQYSDDRQRNQALEIASDPLKAFTYGVDNNWVADKKASKAKGLKKFTYYHKIPNKALFTVMSGYEYRNEDSDGVITELKLENFFYAKPNSEEYTKFGFFGDTEGYVKRFESNLTVGSVIEDEGSSKGYYTHKVEISKARVFGQEGFLYTWIYENDYEIVIKDNYYALTSSGFFLHAGVRYRGNKNDVDFTQLEGRRHYMKRLCNQTIATALIKDIKF